MIVEGLVDYILLGVDFLGMVGAKIDLRNKLLSIQYQPNDENRKMLGMEEMEGELGKQEVRDEEEYDDIISFMCNMEDDDNTQ